jgi:hypothetical protein
MDSRSGIRVGGRFDVVCYGPDGRVKWADEAHNLVVNEGLDHILDVVFAGGTQVNPWYVALLDSDPSPAAGNGMTDLSEFTEYSGDRQAYVDVVSSQQATNSASKASFSITGAGAGVGGAALVAAATGDDTLLCAAALSGGNRTVANGDTVEVTYTFTAGDDGA